MKPIKPIYYVEPEAASVASLDDVPKALLETSRSVAAPRFLVGWREWLQLPEFDVPGIKAKVDTGARSSALHTAEYEMYESGDGEQRVRFVLHPIKGSQFVRECDAPVTGVREVKDSGGHAELRPFITTTAMIGVFSWPIDISLTNREGMRFRMLLGRAALKGYFLVDPDYSYLMSKSLLHRYKSHTS
ncbi:MAG: RimK/LysX family protein [Verrucomicrobia bacterium]|nr:RimK/LysX family protein [Verrucomicrobiota bacterium]